VICTGDAKERPAPSARETCDEQSEGIELSCPRDDRAADAGGIERRAVARDDRG
jgi:hypothetical protein